MTSVALTALLFWPTAGFLAFLIITMWLGAADKAPMGLQIIAAVTLLCAVALLAVPVYCWLYIVSAVSMGGASAGKRKQAAAVEEEEEVGQESFADDSFEDDGEQLEVEDDDFSGSATNEFETLEFSGDDMDFGEEFAMDDDDDQPKKKKK